MYRPRIIPCLLLLNKGLVKTINFANPQYIGDPMNAVKIFNDYEADELVFLDITATKENRLPPIDLISQIAEEAYMPFAVGGGIKTIGDIKTLIQAGAEKVVINSSAILNPNLIQEAADIFGNQSIIASIDAKFDGEKYEAYIQGGAINTSKNPVELAQLLEEKGAGEIMINSIDKDGTMSGYDLELIGQISKAVKIPVIACGGAKEIEDFVCATKVAGATAVAAGSMFVFIGKKRAVLINYPSQEELKIFYEE